MQHIYKHNTTNTQTQFNNYTIKIHQMYKQHTTNAQTKYNTYANTVHQNIQTKYNITMAHIPFQNNVIDLNQLFYNSHKNLIKRVAGELGAKDKQDELIKKLLGDPLKIKRQRDPLMPKKPNSS